MWRDWAVATVKDTDESWCGHVEKANMATVSNTAYLMKASGDSFRSSSEPEGKNTSIHGGRSLQGGICRCGSIKLCGGRAISSLTHPPVERQEAVHDTSSCRKYYYKLIREGPKVPHTRRGEDKAKTISIVVVVAVGGRRAPPAPPPHGSRMLATKTGSLRSQMSLLRRSGNVAHQPVL